MGARRIGETDAEYRKRIAKSHAIRLADGLPRRMMELNGKVETVVPVKSVINLMMYAFLDGHDYAVRKHGISLSGRGRKAAHQGGGGPPDAAAGRSQRGSGQIRASDSTPRSEDRSRT